MTVSVIAIVAAPKFLLPPLRRGWNSDLSYIPWQFTYGVNSLILGPRTFYICKESQIWVLKFQPLPTTSGMAFLLAGCGYHLQQTWATQARFQTLLDGLSVLTLMLIWGLNLKSRLLYEMVRLPVVSLPPVNFRKKPYRLMLAPAFYFLLVWNLPLLDGSIRWYLW